MTEVWKDIEGYEGLYQVSNMGRVRSLRLWRLGDRPLEDGLYIMSPTNNGNGYLIVGLRDDTGRKNHYVHRLVAEAFLQRNDDQKYINHLDYNRGNNKAENLEWCTQHENVLYSIERMRKPRTKHKLSGTGYKYIYYRPSRDAYRIKGRKHEHYAKTIEDALHIREEEWGEVI